MSSQNNKTNLASMTLTGSGSSLAIAVFIVGILYVSAAPVQKELAGVPWQYLPAAMAETSVDFYSKTFIAGAERYLVFIDAVGDIQADSYRTTGSVISSVVLALVREPVDVSHSQPKHRTSVFSKEKKEVQTFLPPTLSMQYVPASDSAPTFLVYLPEQIAEASAGFYGGIAQYFIDGVYAVGDAQVYTYQAISDTMQESANTIGTNAASVLFGAADWYASSAHRVDSRLTSQ